MSAPKPGPSHDVSPGRLAPGAYAEAFCDLHPALDLARAQVEASRCYYCYDAPCIRACPTEIDIPSFIRKIGNGNVRGAAIDILGANVMGGTCARACPVETLCQSACVREHAEAKPVEIGKLQRFATDAFFESGEQPFKRGEPTGLRVAIVGAGPAGLSCAHRLAQLGYETVIYESREKAGGLNEYGLAPYKMAGGFAEHEARFILGVGGIEVRNGQALGRDFTLDQLKKEYAAVFLGIGLGGVNGLGVEGENLPGVHDAARQIERIRVAETEGKLAEVPVGRRVVVIGGGNTAVDIAIQMKRLGAELVTLVYRRGEAEMGATGYEQELAQTNGVLVKTWARPVRLQGDAKGVSAVELEYTEAAAGGKLAGTGRFFTLSADQVFKAIGQTLVTGDALKVAGKSLPAQGGKLVVDARFETPVAGIYAGGDCVAVGEDLTVTSVQHGKLAALAIHEKLSARGAKNG